MNVNEANNLIYQKLKIIAENSSFSKIRMSFNERCTKQIERCSATSCAVPGMDMADGNGVIDLIKTPEGYSPHGYTGRRVWDEIYKGIKNETIYEQIVSGLHFSVTTHIAAFYTQIFGKFISHPRYFKIRFNKARESNFLFLYFVLYNGMVSLTSNKANINKTVLELAKEMEQSKIIKKINKTEIPEDAAKRITGMIKELACIGCQKCRLWGTIQLRGLRAAIRAINHEKLNENDVICLVNAFRRVSETEKERKKLSEMYSLSWRLLVIYQHHTLFCSILLLGWLSVVMYRRKRAKKTYWEKL